MTSLRINLLGPFHVTAAGVPVTSFESDKVRALLALLATAPDRPHRRETLAGMLWPDHSERSARMNLRHALSNLRQAIGDRTPSGRMQAPRFLSVSRQTIQFNRASDTWVDVWLLLELLELESGSEGEVEQLEEAVDCYGGSYLQGFSLPYPKASKSVLEVLTASLGIEIEMSGIDELTERSEREVENLYERFPPEIKEQLDKLKYVTYAKPTEPGPITEEDKKKILEDIDKFFKKKPKED